MRGVWKSWSSKKAYFIALYGLVALLTISMIGTMVAASGISGPIKNAILISWDGVQRDHLRELLDTGQLPNLENLIKEGTIVEIDVTHKTDTKAGHAQMLTGYGPEVTGVYSNSVYQPIPKGYTIFERLEEEYRWLGRIVEKLKKLGIYEETRIYVTSLKGQFLSIRYEQNTCQPTLVLPGAPYYCMEDSPEGLGV